MGSGASGASALSPPIHLGSTDPNRVDTGAPPELLWRCRALDTTPDERRAVRVRSKQRRKPPRRPTSFTRC
jgi:hypothetical protein